MARIQVRLKNGQTGTIDEQEYNPASMQRLDQFQSKSIAGKGLSSILNFLAPETTKTIAKATQGGKVSGGDIGRSALEALSFLIPFGKGAKFLTKAVLPGAGVGLLRGLSQEEKTPESVATSTATGAALSPILSKLLGGGGKLTSKVGEGALRQGTIAGKSTLDRFSQQQALQKLSQKYPQYLAGSGARKFQNAEGLIEKLVSNVDDLYKGVKTKVPGNQFRQAAEQIQTGLQGADKTAFTTIYNRALKDAFPGKKLTGKIDLSGLDINKFRRVLNREATGLISAQSRGVPLTSGQYAILQLRDLTDDLLTSIAPKSLRGKVTTLNKEIGTLIKGIPEFQRLSEESLTLLGTKIPLLSKGLTRGFQAGADVTGRTLSGAGGITGKLVGATETPLGRLGVTQAGITGLATPQTGIPQIPQEEAQQNPELQELLALREQLTSQLQGGGVGGQPTKEQFGQLIIQDLAQTGGKNIGKLTMASKFFEGASAKGGEQSSAALKVLGELQSVYNTVQQQGLTAKSGGLGRILGGIKGTTAAITQNSPEAATYRDTVEGFMSLLSRGLGERGVLTDKDIARVRKAIPKFSDTPAKAAQGWAIVERVLQEASQKEVSQTTNQTQEESELYQLLGL